MRRFAAACLFVSVALAPAADWPQWRGPAHDGTAPAKNLPVKWSEADVAWRVPLPGRSGATPALVGDKLFVSSPDGDKLYLYCVSTAGKVEWRKELASGNRDRGFNSKNNAATPSPIADAKNVWILVGTGDLFCFDHSGARIWTRNLTKVHGPFTQDFGIGNTPLLHDGALYFAVIHRRAESYLLKVDAATGKDVWKVDRPTDAQDESRDGYSSPIIAKNAAGKEELVVCAADFASGYDPANGKELWRSGELNLSGNKFYRFIVTPVAAGDVVVVTACKNGPAHAIRLGGSGDVTKSHRLWTRAKDTPDVATPAIADGLVYFVKTEGLVAAVDLKTGAQVWAERAGSGYFASSPIVAEGKVYVTSERGKLFVLKAGRKFERLATNDLGDDILATPVFADRRIYFRLKGSLVCVETK
ncbi:MAG TPA: PQQ-binding-like beta-propeller repeat protein [Planctomycetia bacterium]|nr:PQQ-binding-like beta-propeller repeat protein [Planctomycetia bacterium]